VELRDGTLWLSPSDLSGHLGCAHLTTLALEAAEGLRPRPAAAGPYMQMVFEKGNEHERAYREQLVAQGREVVEVAFERGDWAAGAARTEALMRAGADVVYQAPFAFAGWRGIADFLERVDEPHSKLGQYSYEAVDTKLARTEMLPHHALQLCFYAAGIQRVQGVRSRRIHVQLGSGRRETIRLHEIDSYANHAKTGMLRAVGERSPTEPVPCEHCPFCPFEPVCEAAWEEADHLTRVAGVRRGQIALLRAAGVSTLTGLARLPAGAIVDGVQPAALRGLAQQARLQLAAVPGAAPPYELLPCEEGHGFAALPEPSAGDVMFDFEGDPFFTPARGLMFLVGLYLRDGEAWRYEAVWAHDPAGEKLAFERLIDLLTARLAAFPDMHVYHYSAAEPSEVKRLMAEHATREAEVDDLLRRRVFVDLLTVTRQALRAGVRSYSLKQTERLAGFVRTADMGRGSDAVLGYERWRASGDAAELEAIAAYNEEDCLATLRLRDWLLEVRPPGISGPAPVPAGEPPDEVREAASDRARLREELIAGEPVSSPRRLAGELLEYHRREARPAWWRYFALMDMDESDLIADAEALGGLTPAGAPRDVPYSVEYDMRFCVQEHRIERGAWIDPANGKSVNVCAIDPVACTLVLRRGKARAAEPLPRALIPGTPLDNWEHRAALERLALAVRDGEPRFRALRDVLAREAPRIAGVPASSMLQTTELERQQALARGLDESTLVVQGPPGTGKTWLGARLIVDLIAHGRRVGVTAMSNKAINNLLGEVERAAAEAGVAFRGARKTGPEGTAMPEGSQIENVDNQAACFAPEFALVAGTTWLFAPELGDEKLDHLVIDEAGQLSLADALAAGTSARNLILLGDPLQLPHVSQAVHPEGTSLSVLEHLLGEAATVPPARGLFLEQTRRMHPAVCGFISEEVYEGRLLSRPDCDRQGVGGEAGIRHLPVAHRGNSSASPEEADAIAAEIGRLLGRPYCDLEGRERPLRPADCMVVTPYNAQRRMLGLRLPDGVRIGTVDSFQGQEAPVVFFSMATSSGEDAPRDVGFLFSRERLNVAISRARCIAYLVCAPALFETRAKTLEQMRLVSTLCALADFTTSPPDAAAA
jgi:predicted RecB family nuclease